MLTAYPKPVYYCWGCETAVDNPVSSDTHYSGGYTIYFCSDNCKSLHDQLKDL